MNRDDIDLASIDGALTSDGFVSRPDWRRVWEWMNERGVTEAELEGAWFEVARQWLNRMANELGSDYMVYETPELFLVSAQPEKDALAVVRHAQRVLRHVASLFPLATQHSGVGKRAILILSDHESYYSYVAHHYPDGEFATSSGCLITDGYRHVVVNGSAEWSILETLTHELAHLSLVERTLPLWLDEGVVQIIEFTLHSSSQPRMTRELLARHRAHWTVRGIQRFWSGEAFHSPDDQELAYSLAHAIANNLASMRGRDFQQLLLDAEWEDFGQAAILKHFDMTLAQCAMSFLGEGPWSSES